MRNLPVSGLNPDHADDREPVRCSRNAAEEKQRWCCRRSRSTSKGWARWSAMWLEPCASQA